MQKLRVLFLHTATRPPLGADTWIHVQIIRRLDRSEHEVHVAFAAGRSGAPTPTSQELARIADLHRHPVDLGPELHGLGRWARAVALVRSFTAILGIAKLAAILTRHKIDVLHTSDRPRDAVVAVLVGRATRTRTIVHCHVGYGDWMGRALKWSLRHADALIAISDFVAGTLVEAGHDPCRVRIVRNGIEPEDWAPGRGREDVRAEFGVPPGAGLVLTVCRLFPSKGPADLIRALATLRSDNGDAPFLLIAGKEMVAGYRRELETLAGVLGVSERVVFTGHRADVEALMAAADVFAMPSLGEPFGLVYLEAMAMALPVVALRSGGAPEVIVDRCTGFLAEPGDIAALGGYLHRLLHSPGLREQMGGAGRARVGREFTCTRMAQDTSLVYKWIVTEYEAGAVRWVGYRKKK
jgi:glycosyltransferase involved in cell wall biosynthesis